MMKTRRFIYTAFVLYTILHLMLFFQNDGYLQAIFTLNVDPLILSLFNLLGLFPMAFLLFALKHYKLKKVDLLPLGFGFLFGAYAIGPFFLRRHVRENKRDHHLTMFALVGIILTIMIAGFGLILGDHGGFIEAFNNDSFIHIMSIDFVVLSVFSVLVLKQHSKHKVSIYFPIFNLFYHIFSE